MAKAQAIYGIHAVESVLKSAPERVLALHVTPTDNPRHEVLLKLAQEFGIAVQRVRPQQLDKWLDAPGAHQGVIAQVKPAPILDETDLIQLVEQKGADTLLLVLDGVTDPQNLGSCLRSCDALGADGIVMAKHKSAPLTPAAIKIASGAADSVPVFQVTNLVRALEQIKEAGVWVYGTAIDETAQPLVKANIRPPAAIVLGSEGKGIRQLTRKTCDHLVYLPMHGVVDSLNVAMAAAIFLFEAKRSGE